MRILRIKGKNLASLAGEFDIDFEKEPLASAGLFAITGVTGSGKSTILDAMCLALFDKTPRIKDVGNAKNSDGKTLQNSINIVRRGARENAYAEVFFIGVDGREFHSKWEVRLKRGSKNRETSLDDKSEISLFVKDENNIEVNASDDLKKKPVLQKIEQSLGLTYEQFTRSVLLAQNEFASFLKANDSEKADILEKLTGTEKFTIISQRIYEKNKSVSDEFKQIEYEKENLTIISLEEKEALSVAENELESEIKKKTIQKETLQKENIIAKDLLDLLEEDSAFKREFASSKEIFEKNEIGYNKLDLFGKVAEIRDHILALLDNKRTIKEKESLLLEKKKEKKGEEDNLEKIEEWFKKTGDAKYKKSVENCENIKNEIEKTLRPLVENNDVEKSEFTVILNDKTSSDDIFEKRNSLIGISNAINNIEKSLAGLENIKKEKEGFLETINLINSERRSKKEALESLVKTLESLKQESPVLVKSLEKKIESLEITKLQSDKIVASLRTNLIHGQPCIVCGSKEHFLDSIKEVTNNDISQLEEEVRALREELDSLTRDIVRKETELKNVKESIKDLEDKVLIHNRKLLNVDNEINTVNEEIIVKKEEVKELKDIDNYLLNEKIQIQLETITKELNNLTIQENRLKLKESLARLVAYIGNADWFGNFDNSFVSKIERLTAQWRENEKKIESLKKNISNFSTSEVEIEKDIALLKEKVEILSKEINNWIISFNKSEENIRLLEIVENKKYLSIVELYAMANESQTSISNERKLLDEVRTKYENLKNSIKDIENRIKSKSEDYRSINNQLELNSNVIKSRLESLQGEINLVVKEINETENNRVTIKVKLKEYSDNLKKNIDINNRLDKLKPLKNSWGKLSEIFGSSDGAKLKKAIGNYTLDSLLEHTNSHLENLSNRYELVRVPSSMGLEILDKEMGDEKRGVNSLSGGESFLVSLGLALGLSSLSSKTRQVNSLFIDEGFGSLDSETLSYVMEVLESLQASGKKIGVISHISDMTEKICAKVEVVKKGNGSSIIKIN